MTFRQWLKYEEKNDTLVGAFARDVSRPLTFGYIRFPAVPTPTAWGRECVLDYLRTRRHRPNQACSDSLAAFEAAWKEWASRFVEVPGP